MSSKQKPRSFRLHFNRLGNKRGEAEIWTVITSKGCRHAKHVDVCVPVLTVFKGDTAPQPRAYLRGMGVVRMRGTGLVITKE